jgi:hypothetical protein
MTFEIPLTTPILYNYFELTDTNNFNVDISELRLKADVNATLGDLMSDVKADKTVTWTLDDGDNADGLRPATVTLKALNGDTVIKAEEVDITSGTHTFQGLPKYDAAGVEITYTFTAVAEHYATSVADTAITLTHTPATSICYYDNDFETDTKVGNAISDQYGNVFTTTGGAFNILDEGCLELNGDAVKSTDGGIGNLPSVVNISFRIRRTADAAMPKDLRIRSNSVNN